MITNKTTKTDMSLARDNVRPLLADPEQLPISFMIGQVHYRGIPRAFSPRLTKRFVDSNIIEYQYSGKDPQTGVAIRVDGVEYLDFPVIEWTVWLENVGQENTPIIQDLCGMDGLLPGVDPVIVSNNGDTCDQWLYTDTQVSLKEVGKLTQFPEGGRACDSALPYYRVLCGAYTYTISIGWPGQWIAEYTLQDGGFWLKAKQQYTHFYLKPGEKVRSPRMTILVSEGSLERSINVWRRWLLAHVVPKPDGEVVRPILSLRPKAQGSEDCQSSETQQLETLEKMIASGLQPNNVWVDAGWYPCKGEKGTNDWRCTGVWKADPERFPNGMRPISDRCHELGMRYLLWFEPERVRLKDCNYPESYLLRLQDESALDRILYNGFSRKLTTGMGLLNLGDPECCDWLIERTDKLIKEYGVDIYRQDFNFPPLHWWMQNETEDRRGLNENFYNQGYLRFWDELLLRNPGLWINSVSSGGRRSDLESLRRSVPLHQSDYGHGEHPIQQAIRTFSFIWQPFCGSLAMSNDDAQGEYDYETPLVAPPEKQNFDNFMAHNAFLPSVYSAGVAEHCRDLPLGEYQNTQECKYYKQFAALWKQAVPYTLDSDFYVLKLTDRTNKCWHAVQFHNEEREEGILQVIRNTRSQEDAVTVYPRQIREDRQYLLESPEFGRSVTVSGRVLCREGFRVTLPERTGEIWFYRGL